MAIRAEKTLLAQRFICSVSRSLMHAIENTVQPEHFSSIRTTMWWSLITLTTVDYRDVSHLTPIGKQVGAFTAIMGVCVEALLTSIVDTTFAN